MPELQGEVRAFLDDVVAAFSDGVVEAFLIGSAATEGFDVRQSDVDVVVVVDKPLADRPGLVARLQRLQPPGRDLELVVYVRGTQPPEHELNFSGGAERPNEPPHWFVLDGAIAEQRSLALCHGRGVERCVRPGSGNVDPRGAAAVTGVVGSAAGRRRVRATERDSLGSSSCARPLDLEADGARAYAGTVRVTRSHS